jgi:hypothetical protein
VIDLPNKKLLGCMQYWLIWNQMCEDFCVWRYQIEQLPEVWDEFCERIGHEKCELPDIPTNINSAHRNHGDFYQYTWDDLFNEDKDLAQEIVEMAKRYGYDVPEMDKTECQNLGELETAQVASVKLHPCKTRHLASGYAVAAGQEPDNSYARQLTMKIKEFNYGCKCLNRPRKSIYRGTNDPQSRNH